MNYNEPLGVGLLFALAVILVLFLDETWKKRKLKRRILDYLSLELPDLKIYGLKISKHIWISLGDDNYIYPSKGFHFFRVRIQHEIEEGVCKKFDINFTYNREKGLFRIDMGTLKKNDSKKEVHTDE